MDDQGVEDSAILLMSLGEEQAADVFRHLDPKEVQRIGETIARLKTVSRERVRQVITRFSEAASLSSALVDNTDEYVKNVLRKALGDEKANILLDRILQGGSDVGGIESLRWIDPQSVAELLKGEHPQVIAAILVHVGYDQAAGILAKLEERTRNEVMIRIATLDGVQPVALKDLNEVLGKLLEGSDKLRKSSLGGVKPAAEIINLMGGTIEGSVIEYIKQIDAELAQQIMDNMFVFEDLAKIDDRGLQTALGEISSDSLVVALKGATPALRDRILGNMSSRAADAMREDLELRGPVRLSEVEAQQKEILQIVRRLADEGKIMLGSSDEDQFV